MGKTVENKIADLELFLNSYIEKKAEVTVATPETPKESSVGAKQEKKKTPVSNDGTLTANTDGTNTSNAAAVADKPLAEGGSNKIPAGSPKKVEAEAGQTDLTVKNLSNKTARAEKLANAIITVIAGDLEKEAAEKEATDKLTDEQKSQEKEAEVIYKEAMDWGQMQASLFARGRIQRKQDVQDLTEMGLTKEAAEQLLDKVAEIDPAAVLPEDLSPAIPAEALAEMPAPAEMPAEEAAAGGDDEMLDQLQGMLDQLGVEPEEFGAALQEIMALKASGVSDEELQAAVEQLAAEESGGEEAKMASAANQPRLELIKEYIRQA